MNFLGVMPGPRSLKKYIFVQNFQPDDIPYEVNNIRINNTDVVDDARWSIQATLIFNSPNSEFKNDMIQHNSANENNGNFDLTKVLKDDGILPEMTPTEFEAATPLLNHKIQISSLNQVRFFEHNIYLGDIKGDAYIDMTDQFI